ncbi:MAG: phosphoribosylaminoimidazolecarboxamide formyltransferase/IMP cyclohydrolase [Candidatus Omnitrophota bacterium]
MGIMLNQVRPVKRALISVFDKTGLEEFVRGLIDQGIEIVSSGGTAKAIKKAGLAVKEVQELTGFPEMLDGRVKTLHPYIHGGILARRDSSEHMQTLKKHKIKTIDLVVVSLYPFEETVKKAASYAECIEMIDIGGPTMLRAAAKNYDGVGVVCDSQDYSRIIDELKAQGGLTSVTRQSLSAKVFQTTARYDSLIAAFMTKASKQSWVEQEQLTLSFSRVAPLRYGENPHQVSSVFKLDGIKEKGLTSAKILGGKELSYNNYLDLEAAWSLVSAFKASAATVVKHNNPCGFALDENLSRGFKKAFDCDPLSAFGGIVAINRKIDESLAKTIIGAGFLECVIAPGYTKEAMAVFRQKKNLRFVSMPVKKVAPGAVEYKRITGGLLVQSVNSRSITTKDLKQVTKKKVTDKQIQDLLLGFALLPFIKSNGIALVKNNQAVGIGMGQPSRVDSVITALRKAGPRAKGSVLASDGFFPKADSIEFAVKHGVKAVIQPGGSILDKTVVAACDKAGIPMVVTGIRHFSH